MKFIKEELSGSQHPRYMFALGKNEAIILYRALWNAWRWTPKTIETETTIARIKGMIKTMRESLKGMVDDKPDQ